VNRRSFLRLCLGISSTPLVADESVGLLSWAWSKITSWLSRPKPKPAYGEVLVPVFEIASCPTIRLSDIKVRRFYIVDRAQIKAREAIQKEEGDNIFRTLMKCA